MYMIIACLHVPSYLSLTHFLSGDTTVKSLFFHYCLPPQLNLGFSLLLIVFPTCTMCLLTQGPRTWFTAKNKKQTNI